MVKILAAHALENGSKDNISILALKFWLSFLFIAFQFDYSIRI